MISADAILQATATMIVGTIFVLTLREAIGLKVTRQFAIRLVLPMACFIWSASTALFVHEEWICGPNWDYWIYLSARLAFFLGLFFLMVVLLWNILLESLEKK
jgi:hypothetical protein